MTVPEALAGCVGMIWLGAGILIGTLRYGCFAGLGIGLAAGLAGLLVGHWVFTRNEDVGCKIIRLRRRRPRLGTALAILTGSAFLAASLSLTLGPMAIAYLSMANRVK